MDANILDKKNLPEEAAINLLNNILTRENTNVKPEFIMAEHKADFYKSGVTDEILDSYIQEGCLESQENGWKLHYPELLENTKTDYYTLRFDNPPKDRNGKEQGKYKRPTGKTSKIFRPLGFNPEILEDTIQPIIITEGEKKAIKAIQEGFNCLAVSGVWCWKSKQTDDSLIPDLHKIKWEGREVYLCFDNDVVIKPQVKQALYAFIETLASFGAIVRPVYLPTYNKVNKKLGLDDYLIEYGAEEFQKLIDNARMPADLLLNKVITRKNEDFGKKIKYEIEQDYKKDFEFIKHGLYAINNNYYEIRISKHNDKDWELEAIRKSNFILKIQREVINNSLKFDYQTEHKVEIVTIIDGKLTKHKILTVAELLNFKNSADILKTNGLHLHYLNEVEYKNVILKELNKKPAVLNSFENPGFNILGESNLWTAQNLCIDLYTNEQFSAGKNGYIEYKGQEITLKVNKGFQSPKIKVLGDLETTDCLLANHEYIKEVKEKYKSCTDSDITPLQLITLALFDNICESYNFTIEPFLILGMAVLSPFVSEIFKKMQGYPIGFAGGESQSGKSNLLITIASLYGFKHNSLKSGNDTVKNLLHNIEFYSKIPLLIQETGKNLRDRIEDFLIKPVYDRTGRGLMQSGEEQNIKAVNSTLIIASNDSIHKNLQTSSRLVFTDWKKDNFDKNKAKKFNNVRENLLSAILPSILGLSPEEILQSIDNNINFIEQNNFNIDTRSINNIALAKTGLDIIINLTGLNLDTPVLKNLNEKYSEFLKNYNEAVSVKDSFDSFLEIFELLVRDKKITENIDWKLVNSDSCLTIYLKSVYPRFTEYFKRTHDNSINIPTAKDIRNGAKKRGFDINHGVSFGSTAKKAVYIPMDNYDHLLSILKDLSDPSISPDSSNSEIYRKKPQKQLDEVSF